MAEDELLAILENMWALRPDATPLQRLLAWRPLTGEGWRHRAREIDRLRREQRSLEDRDTPASST
jgi:hypothetical protein